jgi:hypothetical protein
MNWQRPFAQLVFLSFCRSPNKSALIVIRSKLCIMSAKITLLFLVPIPPPLPSLTSELPELLFSECRINKLRRTDLNKARAGLFFNTARAGIAPCIRKYEPLKSERSKGILVDRGCCLGHVASPPEGATEPEAALFWPFLSPQIYRADQFVRRFPFKDSPHPPIYSLTRKNGASEELRYPIRWVRPRNGSREVSDNCIVDKVTLVSGDIRGGDSLEYEARGMEGGDGWHQNRKKRGQRSLL